MQDQLNQRKREFSKVEREIELKIQAQEEHERLAAQNDVEEEEDVNEEDNNDNTGQVHRPQQGKLCPANVLSYLAQTQLTVLT